MKRLYINGRFLTQPLSGMQRYAEELVTALDKRLAQGSDLLSQVASIEVLVPQGVLRQPAWQHIRLRQIGRLSGHAWEQFELAWAARDGVLLNLISCGPLLHGQSVLVMHDAAIFVHPEHFSRSYRMWHRFLRPRLARRALRLVTISEFSRRELARCCGVDPALFTIIGDSAEHIMHVEADEGVLARHGLQAGQYALTVGNQSPNKNIALAIQAFEQSALQGWSLAVAGGGSEKIFGTTADTSAGHVKRLGRVTDGELKALYQHAGLFLFPSRYEGFGVPPLEAMTLGCAVLSSDSSAMPEVLGQAAAFFPCDDADAFARQITALANNPTLRAQHADAGLVQASRYSWASCAAVLETVLVPLLNGKKAS